MKMRYGMVLIPALLLGGCAREGTRTPGDVPQEPSTTRTLIEGITGKTAVEAGKKAKRTIETTSAARNQDLDDVLSKE